MQPPKGGHRANTRWHEARLAACWSRPNEMRRLAMDVAVNGTTLYAEQTGEGPSAVFVHGMCGDARVWADQAERLGDRFRCTRYDRRGHTRSSRTDATATVHLHAAHLAGPITE